MSSLLVETERTAGSALRSLDEEDDSDVEEEDKATAESIDSIDASDAIDKHSSVESQLVGVGDDKCDLSGRGGSVGGSHVSTAFSLGGGVTSITSNRPLDRWSESCVGSGAGIASEIASISARRDSSPSLGAPVTPSEGVQLLDCLIRRAARNN